MYQRHFVSISHLPQVTFLRISSYVLCFCTRLVHSDVNAVFRCLSERRIRLAGGAFDGLSELDVLGLQSTSLNGRFSDGNIVLERAVSSRYLSTGSGTTN